MKHLLSESLGEVTVEVSKTSNEWPVLILAHGAGAGMHHPFMVAMAEKLAKKGITTIRFNFPYMEAGRKSPGSPKANIAAWKSMVDMVKKDHPDARIFLAGKSYGGRMASHLIVENSDIDAAGIVYVGFPLHAPGKDSKDRAAHLSDIQIPQLFLQGEKDKLANIDMMREVVGNLQNATLEEFRFADHSFKTPKSAGISPEEMMENLADITAEWIKKQ
jgi:predicted alpha/beta-hydrolase family hydrolase